MSREQLLDYFIVGSGIGGLFTGALLANAGASVALAEKHYSIGGYGHSFRKKGYLFCAQLHYLWNCNEGDLGHRFFQRLGLADSVRFVRLDPEGFDRLHFPSFHYTIKSGFDRNIEALSARYPKHRKGLTRYFRLLARLNAEVQRLPNDFSWWSAARHAISLSTLVRYRNWTLGDLFKSLRFPLELRSILAGQSGNLLLPPSQVSLIIHAAMATGYDAGACVPEKDYEHLFESVGGVIAQRSDQAIMRRTEIVRFEADRDRITAAVDKKGNIYRAHRFIFNGDPKLLRDLLPDHPRKKGVERKLRYEYSASCVSLYLGVRGLDLKSNGFGNWNVWHYTDDDLEAVYRRHFNEHDFQRPSLFISTPTLHCAKSTLAPDGADQLVVCSHCPYEAFAGLKRKDRRAYRSRKTSFANAMLDELEKTYLPDLRSAIELQVVGTPTTNEFWVNAPQGNAYGASLTTRNFRMGKISYQTPYRNLFLAGATAGAPSFAAGLHFAVKLFERLSGQTV